MQQYGIITTNYYCSECHLWSRHMCNWQICKYLPKRFHRFVNIYQTEFTNRLKISSYGNDVEAEGCRGPLPSVLASPLADANRRSCHLCFSTPSKGQDNTLPDKRVGQNHLFSLCATTKSAIKFLCWRDKHTTIHTKLKSTTKSSARWVGISSH